MDCLAFHDIALPLNVTHNIICKSWEKKTSVFLNCLYLGFRIIIIQILAQLALDEDRAVTVNYRGINYIVDNNQNITSLQTGNVMKWVKENGDRKAIIEMATLKFRDYINEGKKSIATQMIDHLATEDYAVGDEVDMEKYLSEHPISSTVRAMERRREAQEMQTIKEQAIKDGTFMKAPNGKDTNLNERQWLQVRTKNFIKWFGDWINDPANASKVVDENGEPKVMFRMDEANKSIMGRGKRRPFFATDKLMVAGSYARGDVNLYEGFVNLKNPFMVMGEAHGFFFTYKGKETFVHEAQQDLINDGYDGVYFERTWDVGDMADVEPGDDYWANNVAMFNPNQFKSATNNNGMFSRENDDIQMSVENNSEKNNNFAENSNIYNNETKNAAKTAGEIFQETYRLLERRSESSDSKSQSLREGIREEARKQQSIILNWAKNNGKLIVEPSDYYYDEYGEGLSETTESIVWKDEKREVAVKAISLNHYGEIGKLLDRILIHNMAFPNFAMMIQNIGIADSGISIIVEQPWAKDSGELPTYEELEDYMINTLGFTLQKGKGANAEYIKNGYLISDIRPENVIKQQDGTFAVIDCFAMFQNQEALTNVYEQLKNKSENNYNQDSIKKESQFYLTPEGEVYGFVDKEGKIYLDRRVITAEHPMHEFTHLWDRVVQKKNPELWNRGKELMRKLPQWQEVLNDDNYGKKWVAKGMSQEQLDDYIASEVHSRIVGKQGETLLENLGKKNGYKKIINNSRSG